MSGYNLDIELARPKNVKGESKQIGVWDWETEHDPYTRFKSLGAKRYIYEQGGELHITVAGVSKRFGRDYLKSTPDAFDAFKDGLTIPPEYTGKLTHSYLDEEQQGTLTDYRGVSMEYEELSSVHLEPAMFTMSILEEYKNYIKGVKKIWSILYH